MNARVATEDKHGLRSGLRNGPNSAKEAEQLGSDRTPDQKNKTKTKNHRQATSEIRRKVADIPPLKRRNLRHYD